MHRRTLVSSILLALAVAFPLRGSDDPAQLVPADATIYAEFRDLASVRTALHTEPLAVLESLPLGRREVTREAWARLQAVLGLDGEQIFDRYFGRRVGLAIRPGPTGTQRVLLCEVSEEDRTRLTERLGLARIGGRDGFGLYRTSDAGATLAVGEGKVEWIAIGEASDRPLLDEVVTRTTRKRLAAEPLFVEAWKRLPAKADARLYVREPGGTHAATARVVAGAVEIEYAGLSPRLADLLGRMSTHPTVDFGPLPPATVAAIAVPLDDHSVARSVAARINPLLAPATFEADLAPALGSPMVLFAATTTAISPRPAIGLMLKMKRPEASQHLDRLARGLFTFANLLAAGRLPAPIELATHDDGEETLGTAHLGHALLGKDGDWLNVSFGRVGSWYLLGSHPSLHTGMRHRLRIDDHSAPSIPRFPDRPGRTLAAFFHADALSKLLLPMIETLGDRPQTAGLRSFGEELARILAPWQQVTIDLYHDADVPGLIRLSARGESAAIPSTDAR